MIKKGEEKYEGPERRAKLPDWLMRILTTVVIGAGSASIALYNNSIIAQQDIINLKDDVRRLDAEVIRLRDQTIKQADHNERVLTIIHQSINRRAR